ncbi:MAG: hypothetical protein MJ104_06200 [Lachnospiraceae bacterium]|nr:hypothetical protein [Lachnospiraceae bacterium]
MKTRTTKIISWVVSAVVVAMFVISVVQSINGITPNWGLNSMVACCLTCVFASISAKEKKEADKESAEIA